MKKNFYLIATMSLLCMASVANAQMRVGSIEVPNASAILDLNPDDNNNAVLGLALPRVKLDSTMSYAPLNAHVAGMFVYNTVTAGDVTPGIYYNDGTKWIAAGTGAIAASVIKKLTIDINSVNSFQSVFWQGTTGVSSNTVEVVGIEPVITSPEGDMFINQNLTISTSAKVVSGAIAYTLKVRNENIDASKNFTVNSINIYYTCNDMLDTGNPPVYGSFVGQ